MRERPILFSGEMVRAILDGRKTQTRRVLKPEAFCPDPRPVRPDYEVGMRLWVREAHLIIGGAECANPRVVYSASNDGPDQWVSPAWRPSIHMPRWASRITLEVTRVSVERIQWITQEDAKAEGCQCVAHYHTLWDGLNKARGFGWEKNPWVWAVEFKRA